MRLRSRFLPALNRHDAPVGTDREEAIPAGSATIGGKMKQAEQPGKRARSMLAGNPLEIKVTAHCAMRVPGIGDGDGPRIKSLIATPAAPGPQQSGPDRIVLHTPPPRTTGTVTKTRRAKQFCFSPGKACKSIREGSRARQVPSAICRCAVYNYTGGLQSHMRDRTLFQRAQSRARTPQRKR
jgi:hypothetical protein